MGQKRFFITFGSDPTFPYPGGYLIVYADTMAEAMKLYRKDYPDLTPGVPRFAMIFSEEEWEERNIYEMLFPGKLPWGILQNAA